MTIKEIAKLAGVSPAAVSMVLNNRPGISDARRQEILALLQQYNYGAPKAGLTAAPKHLLFLKYIKSGFIVVENTGFVASILDSIEAECRSRGYLLRIEVSRENLEGSLAAIDFADLSGIFVLGTELDRDLYPLLDRIPVPYVVLDNRMGHSPCNAIAIDNYETVREAAAFLRGLGYSRIGYLRSSIPIRNFDDRADGLRRSCGELGLSLREEDIFPLRPYMLGAYEDMKEFLEEGRALPPCVFADNDTIALGAMKALLEKKIRIPEDISVIGFDDIVYSAVSSPALTTMRIPTALIGRMAVRTLESAMADSELKGCKVLIGGTLVERASTAPCAAEPQRGGAA